MYRPIAQTVGRGRAAATAALLLIAALATLVAARPSDAATQPSLLVTVGTDNSALAGAPAAALPTVLAAKGESTIQVTLSVSDGTDLSKGTVINFAPVRGDLATPLGSFTPSAVTVPSKGSTFTFTVAYSAAEDGIALRAALKKASASSPLPGQSLPFDVLNDISLTPKGSPTLATGLGADSLQHRDQRIGLRRRRAAPWHRVCQRRARVGRLLRPAVHRGQRGPLHRRSDG